MRLEQLCASFEIQMILPLQFLIANLNRFKSWLTDIRYMT